MGKPNIQNLVPQSSRTKEEQRKIASMGGSVKSLKKKYAAQLRELKKRSKFSSDDEKRLLMMITDPEFQIMDKIVYLDKIRNKLASRESWEAGNTAADMIKLLNAEINLYKAHFGDKKNVEVSGEVSAPIVVNFGVDTSEYLDNQIKSIKKLKENKE